ncbi:MAG: hypothetical protein PSN34_14640 [Urechidicola sp.]|nr:hypothetical protein [Urechidicola sp.]
MFRSYLSIPKKHLAVFFVLFFSFSLYSQDESSDETKKESVEKSAFAINDISEESERVNQQLSGYKDVLIPSGTVTEVDSLLAIRFEEINIYKDSLLLELETVSRRDLKVKKVKWQNYRSDLKGYQIKINARIQEVSEVSDKIVVETSKWKFTKDELTKNINSNSVFENIDGIVESLSEVLEMATFRLKAIYTIDNKLTEIILINDEILAKLDDVELSFKKDYFIVDSNPIWKKADSITRLEVANSKIKKKGFIEQLKVNKKAIFEFYTANIKVAIVQVSFILLIFLLLMNVKKRWIVKLKDLSNPVEIQSKIILKNPFASTAIVGVLISAFFYEALIPNVAEFFCFNNTIGRY